MGQPGTSKSVCTRCQQILRPPHAVQICEAGIELDENAMAGAAGHKWADWIEPDFPFFSSVLDARDAGEGFPKDNLTPRGLILNLGHNLWACFDTDLLRIACIWQGEEGKPPVTPVALAPGSYHIAGQKTKDGQDDLPKPEGAAKVTAAAATVASDMIGGVDPAKAVEGATPGIIGGSPIRRSGNSASAVSPIGSAIQRRKVTIHPPGLGNKIGRAHV